MATRTVKAINAEIRQTVTRLGELRLERQAAQRAELRAKLLRIVRPRDPKGAQPGVPA